MTNIPNRETFENAYAGKAPWDIGRPQKVFVDATNKVTGSVLDAGCGTGENALFFAERGHKVIGLDYLREPIERAKQKAADRGIAATFVVLDALRLDAIAMLALGGLTTSTTQAFGPYHGSRGVVGGGYGSGHGGYGVYNTSRYPTNVPYTAGYSGGCQPYRGGCSQRLNCGLGY